MKKKASNTSYQSRIDEKEARKTRLVSCITDKFEFKDTQCEIKYNTPEAGKKQILRKDTGELVETEDMNEEESQEELEFQEAETKRIEEAAKEKLVADGKKKSEKRKNMKERQRRQKDKK